MLFNKKEVYTFDDVKFTRDGKFTAKDEIMENIVMMERLIVPKDDTLSLEKIKNYVSKLPHKQHNEEEFRKRTASEIVKSGYSIGCTDDALVFITLARQCGIPARYVETFKEDWIEHGDLEGKIEGHVFASIKMDDGGWKIYDPAKGSRSEYMVREEDSTHYCIYLELGIGTDFSEIYPKTNETKDENGRIIKVEYSKTPVCIGNYKELRKAAKKLKQRIELSKQQ